MAEFKESSLQYRSHPYSSFNKVHLYHQRVHDQSVLVKLICYWLGSISYYLFKTINPPFWAFLKTLWALQMAWGSAMKQFFIITLFDFRTWMITHYTVLSWPMTHKMLLLQYKQLKELSCYLYVMASIICFTIHWQTSKKKLQNIQHT